MRIAKIKQSNQQTIEKNHGNPVGKRFIVGETVVKIENW